LAYIIGFLSQKGGSGKSTLARLLARELAANDYSVKIADLDAQQLTCVNWAAERGEREPVIDAQAYPNLQRALRDAGHYDAMLIDGRANASKETAEIAKISDLVIIPTKTTRDDMQPNVMLAHALVDAGVPVERIAFVFTQTAGSEADLRDARRYFSSTEYDVLEGHIELKTSYGRANDTGAALTEVGHKSLRAQAAAVAQGMMNKLADVGEKEREKA
jgi:chromosome partitioning protein